MGAFSIFSKLELKEKRKEELKNEKKECDFLVGEPPRLCVWLRAGAPARRHLHCMAGGHL